MDSHENKSSFISDAVISCRVGMVERERVRYSCLVNKDFFIYHKSIMLVGERRGEACESDRKDFHNSLYIEVVPLMHSQKKVRI